MMTENAQLIGFCCTDQTSKALVSADLSFSLTYLIKTPEKYSKIKPIWYLGGIVGGRRHLRRTSVRLYVSAASDRSESVPGRHHICF